MAHNKVSNKVFQTAYKAQFGRGAESYMFSWTDNTGHVRDTVKLFQMMSPSYLGQQILFLLYLSTTHGLPVNWIFRF